MKEKKKEYSRIQVNKEVLQQLNIYKANKGFRTHNDSIKDLLKKIKGEIK